jgi:hypothetical protein
MTLTLSTLKKRGFIRAGFWALNKQQKPGLVPILPEKLEMPGIYLFVVSNKINYVGRSRSSINSRLKRYDYAFQHRPPRRTVDKEIIKALKQQEVDIYIRVLAENSISYRNGLPFDFLEGLEAGLIIETGCGWNRGARTRILSR